MAEPSERYSGHYTPFGKVEMLERLALDRFATARVLGPRLEVVLIELIQNDRFRVQASRLLEAGN